MRATTIGTIISMGLGLCVAAGDVGCAAKTSSHGFEGSGTSATAAAKPILDNVPASELTAQHYGIKTWKVFVGRSQIIYEGYDVNGKPIEGCQVAWFKPAQNTPAHLRLTVLDGSTGAMRLFGSTTSGHFSGSQAQFLMHIGYDFQQIMANPGSLSGASANGMHIHEDWTWVGVGSYVAAGGAAIAAVAGAPVTAAVLGVAAAGMGLYSYVTENPNPSTPPSQVSQVTADPQSGQLTETPTQDAPSSQTFDQQWNQDMDALGQTQTCPSCSDPNGDLNVNPQNGDVNSGSPEDPSNPGSSGGSGNPTGDGSDPGAADQTGTPTPSTGGPSTGGGTGDDGSGDASQDQGTQDPGTQDQAAQDQAAQDQGAQDQAAQDQGTQDQAAQDQASQDQASQDQASQDQGQDALHPIHHRRHHRHHRHHPKTAWGRISSWLVEQYKGELQQ